MGSENQKPIIMYFDDAKVGLQNLFNLCSTQLQYPNSTPLNEMYTQIFKVDVRKTF